MQIVIDIPEETYEYWKEHSYEYVFAQAIKDGVILPKGHGRLIDADEIAGDSSWDFADRLDETPTIIEADKGESEDKE